MAVTRRALLRRAAGVGAASLLVTRAAPASAGRAAEPSFFELEIGLLDGRSAPFAAARQFVLVGASWTAPTAARIELRVRATDGDWSRWALASVLGHDGDRHIAVPGLFGDPLWTGPAEWVQLRSAQRVQGLSLHFVADQPDPSDTPAAGSGPVTAAAAAAGSEPLAQPVLDAGAGQPPIIARWAWAGAAGPAFPPGYGSVQLAFIHHTDSPNGYSAPQVPAIIRSIYVYHRYVRGWNDIGYNFLIDAFGRTWEGRAGGIDLPVVGAHAGGYNLESTGVAMLGTFDGVLPTVAAQSALERLLAWKLSLHGLPSLGEVTVEVDPADAFYTRFLPGQHVSLPRIAGHRDGCTTDCPGNALYARLPGIRPSVSKLATSVAELTIEVTGGHVSPASYLTLADSTLLAGTPLAVSGRLSLLSGTLPSAPAPKVPTSPAPTSTTQTSTTPTSTTPTSTTPTSTTPTSTTPTSTTPTSTTPTSTTPTSTAPHAARVSASAARAPGRPFAAAPVQLRAVSTDAAGTATEKLLASVTTAVDGTWTTPLVGTENLLLRAVHTGHPAVVSPLVFLAVAPVVTLAEAPGSQRSGPEAIVNLTGAVAPAKSTVVIVAQPTHGPTSNPVRQVVRVVRGQFMCKLRLPGGVYEVWAETLSDPRNVAGRSQQLRLEA